MNLRRVLAAFAIAVLVAAPAWALDSVKTAKALVSGNIQEIGKYTVKIKRTGDRDEAAVTPAAL